jgi:oligosaccharide repeat unit polymerase
MTHHLVNFSAILTAGALLYFLWTDLRHGSYRIVLGRSAVLVTVFLWYLWEALRLPPELCRFSQSEYDFGMGCVLLSVGAFLAAYHACRCPLFAPFARRLPMVGNPSILWLLVVTGMAIGFGSIVIYSGFDFAELLRGLTGARRRFTGFGRSRYGSWSTIIFELQMFLRAVIPLAVALAFLKTAPFGHRLVAGMFVAWMFLRQFFSGTRSPMIPILLSLAAAVFWYAPPRVKRQLVILGVPAALALGIFWSAVIVAGRNEGDFEIQEAEQVDYVGYEMFRELLAIKRITKDDLPLQWGMTYYTQLVNPIPRAIWPGKPVADAGLLLARAYGAVDKNGEPTMTNSPGFLGEAYLNFGFLGLLLVPALAGVFVRAWDELFLIAAQSFPAFLIYPGGIATIFVSGRSFNFSAFYGMLSLFLLMTAFEMLGLNAAPGMELPPVRHLPRRWPATT